MSKFFNLPLKFNPKLEPMNTLLQACYLWPKGLERGTGPMFPGKPYICRLQNGRRFLWRIYAHLDHKSSFRVSYFAYHDVELVEETDRGSISTENKTLVEIIPITTVIENFQEVLIDVWLDCSSLKVNLLPTKDCLIDTVRGFFNPFTFFCKGTRLDFRCLREESMGICAAYVKDTQGDSFYGEIGATTLIRINQLFFHSNTRLPKQLGGIDSARVQLETALTEGHSLLIHGPRGTGKYGLVKALAVEKNIPLFEIRGSHCLRSLPGETEAEMRKTFLRLKLFEELIEKEKRVLLLVKDIDTICPKIDMKKGQELVNVTRVASQFISLVDQYKQSSENIIIIGTTSSIESMDTRLRRPGRLDKEIALGVPSKEQRIDILRCFNKVTRLSLTEEQLETIANQTAGYVGAELELLYYNLVREIKSKHLPFEEILAEVQKKNRPSSLRTATGVVGGMDPSLSLDSCGGLDTLKAYLRLCIVEQLANPDRFRRLGIHPLRGILLYGPPGCAKTTLVKCLAAETGMTFLSLSAAQVYSPYVGGAEKLITRVFNEARTNAPAVVFLDEIDSLVGNRGTTGKKHGSGAANMGVLSTLLMEMDGIGQAEQMASALSEDSKRVVVIAATNRPDLVDDALLRPGRLTKLIHIPAPNEAGRLAILRKLANRIPFAENVNRETIARHTYRFSGADLENLCTTAALIAVSNDLNATVITMNDMELARLEVEPSLTKEQIAWYHLYEGNRQG